MAQLDACLLGDQIVGSVLAGSGNIMEIYDEILPMVILSLLIQEG